MLEKNLISRKTLRLHNYDYSQSGAYFVTICTEKRQNLFGHIVDNQMALNAAGEMVFKWVEKLSSKFEQITIAKFVLMPNHMHLIGVIAQEDLQSNQNLSLSAQMQWFKTMTTNAYINGVKASLYPPFTKRVWQHNYYEHVIRNAEDYERLWDYIDQNPLKWALDEYSD